MKAVTFFILLIITGGLLFWPTIQAPAQIELTPSTPSTTTITMRSTSLQFSTTIQSSVMINISYINPDGQLTTVQTNVQLIQSLFISLPHRGSYQLTMLSPDFGIVQVKQSGLATPQLIYFTVLILIFFYVVNKNYGIIS